MTDLSPFAVACYQDNSIAELEQALIEGPDLTDLREWNLTEAEWTESVAAALAAKRQDRSV